MWGAGTSNSGDVRILKPVLQEILPFLVNGLTSLTYVLLAYIVHHHKTKSC